ncbi:MAG: glycosyltransferase [Burkholderiales bacterium]
MISVLVPVHRLPLAWFNQCLASIEYDLALLENAHPDQPPAEIVIVNDGSDQTDLLNYLEGRSKQPRYRVVHSASNVGIPAALNLGIEACRHELIARVDSDDITLPGRFLAQWELMQTTPSIDVLGTALNYYMQQPGGAWAAGQLVRHPDVITREIGLRSRWFMNHGTVMYRKSVLTAVGMYDAGLRGYSEDFELWIRLLRHGRVLWNLPTSYYLLRIRTGSASQGFNAANDAFLRTTQATLRE